MNKKQISMVIVGAILLYGGVLSLADEWYVGAGMMMGGSILAIIPLWKAFVHFRNSAATPTMSAAGTRKHRRKHHLTVVRRDEEDRTTYH
jgi:hypothetical protein